VLRPIQTHLRSQGRRLLVEFEALREEQRDSDVKGGGNEAIVAEFMRRHYSTKIVVPNSSIIDTNDQQSDEIDVIVCNEDQPFVSRTSVPDLLLAEGVDFVVQVKAILTSDEVKRVVRNCRSVKRLRRIHTSHDQVFLDAEADVPFFVERIPYLCFAFQSDLSLPTAAARLQAECAEVPLEEQPDALFVLGRGMVVNGRNGEGTLAHGFTGFNDQDLVDDLGDWTLLGLLRCLYLMVPRFRRWQNPLIHYMGTGLYAGGKLLQAPPPQ
jgi:hypothetical protein